VNVTRSQIARILDPESVAVVGASTDPTKRGHQAIETLQHSGYEGEIYPVNPSAEQIRGLEVYPTVSAIPGAVDLALIVTPASIVPDVLEDCGESGVAGAVVIAVGFGEADEEGERLEEQIVEIASEYGIRLVGPNTSGLINVHEGVNLVGAEEIPAGNLGLLCQSGNMAIALFAEALNRHGTGFSYYIGVGNESDLRFDEYVPYLASDDRTDAIVMYVEGMRDGRRFLQTARDYVDDVPIVALKSGRSEVGKSSASSHTGSLAGDSAVADAVFEQAGIISVKRSDELLAVSRAVADLPAADGPNVAVLADGGGHATLAADALSERGLSIPNLNDETRDRLDTILPDAASTVNPVDVAGGTDDDPGVFFDCAEALVADPNVDVLFVTGLFGGYAIRFSPEFEEVETKTATRVAELVEKHDMPVVVQSAYERFEPEAHERLRASGIPVLESLDVSASSIAALAERGAHLEVADEKSHFRLPSGESNADWLERVNTSSSGQLSEFDARTVLAESGVPIVPHELAKDGMEAKTAVQDFGNRVAMKVVSADLVHKSDIGGVALDVDANKAAETYERLVDNVREHRPEIDIDGVLVSPMRTEGIETIVGVTRDRQFGPVLMFGLGGVFVEVFEDVAFRAIPVTEVDARAMVDEVKAQPLLDGVRGGEPVDREALVGLLVSVSEFVVENPAVEELDLNPVIASADGVEALDATISLQPEAYKETAEVIENKGEYK